MSDHPFSSQYQALRQLIANALDSVQAGQFSLDSFDRILELCQCVPMTSAEYQATVRRAHGALEACLSAEFGAAAFDLRLLLRSVERLMASEVSLRRESHTVSPRRRRADPDHARFHPPVMRA